MEMLINEKTELKPSDLIKSPKGKVYKIDTYSGDKNTYRIYLIPAKAGEENPPFSIITKQNLVAKKWELASKEDIKEKTEELTTEGETAPEPDDTLFIKEDKMKKEES